MFLDINRKPRSHEYFTFESCWDKSGFLTAIYGPAVVIWILNFRYLGFWITLKSKKYQTWISQIYQRSCIFYNLDTNFQVVSCLEKIMIYKISTFNHIISAISATLENCYAEPWKCTYSEINTKEIDEYLAPFLITYLLIST